MMGRMPPPPCTTASLSHLGAFLCGVLGLVLSACGSPPAPPQQAGVQMHKGPIFNEAFTDGFMIAVDEQRYQFRPQLIGEIRLESGQLVACDPLVSCDLPFTQAVPAGRFPLQLAIARNGEDERIGFARIVFAPGRIEAWELALTAGQDRASLKPGEFFGYGVDSGTGAFMDLAALREFEARRQREGEEFDDALFEELDKHYQHTRSWHLLETAKGTVAMFSSGYGDGVYSTWFGYDSRGKLIAAITDFGLVPWE
ncbi:hypothetical protein C0V76_00565 [Uliginosibacterium sp. TH139]|nr:hypothetical protein C0V76_00565 [Uliginosibacterium sp. TH139]